MNRPDHIMDVMRKQHGGCWYSFGGKEPVYENIVLDSKIWDNSINDLIDNPYEIPTKEFLESELARQQAEYDAQDYARNRARAYPRISDQLDMLWHAVDTGDWTAAKVKTTEFYTALKAVKDANPKP